MEPEKVAVPDPQREADRLPSAAKQAGISEVLKQYAPSSVGRIMGLGSSEKGVMEDGDSMLSLVTEQMLSKYLSEFGLTSLLAFADRKALAMLQRVETFSMVFDKLQRFTNALSLALAVWSNLPAPVRTGILYLTGRVMHALPKGMFTTMEAYIVDADREVKNTSLAFAVEKLTLVVQVMSNPVSSAIGMGKMLYSYFWGAAPEQGVPDLVPAGDAVASDGKASKESLAKIDLRIIWVEVKGLHLEGSKDAAEGGSQTEGGLHADFALGARMFGHQRSIGENGKLTLIFPWSGGAVLEMQDTVSILSHVQFKDLFEIDRLDMTLLKASNDGIQELGFALNKFGIFNDTVTMSEATAAYSKSTGMVFAGTAALNILQWSASGGLKLELDAEGHFLSGSIDSFSESKDILSVGKVSLHRDQGFYLESAALNLNNAVGIDLTAFVEHLDINNKSVSGKGGIKANNTLTLFGDRVKMTDAVGTLAVTDQTYRLDASAGLDVNISGVKAGGKFAISRDSAAEQTSFELQGGYFSADYDSFQVESNGIAYNHADGKLIMPKAEVSLKALGIKGEVHDLEIDKTGVVFKQAKISGPETINLLPGLVLQGLSFEVSRAGEEYAVKLLGGVEVNTDSPKLKGKVSQAALTLDKDGFRANVESLSLEMAMFRLSAEKAAVSKDGFHVDTATLEFLGRQAGDSEQGTGILGLNSGLLDFLPLNRVGVRLTDVDFSGQGLKVGSFKPMIPPLSFRALGIAGEVDFENLRAKLAGEKAFSLADMVPGLPLSVSIMFPIVPGLEVYGSLGAAAQFALSMGMEAQGDNGVWRVAGNTGIKGDVGLRVELGVQAGTQAILALSAGVFAQGTARMKADASIAGKAKYDRETKRFKREEPLVISYSLAADAVASVGIVVKAKALYFLEKKLYEWTAAEWVLGSYSVKGELGEKDDEAVPSKGEKLGLDRERSNPAPVREIVGRELDELLTSEAYIMGSGEARKKILAKEHDVKHAGLISLQTQRVEANSRFEKRSAQYMRVMAKKEAYFHKLLAANAPDTNAKLEAFNAKYKLDVIWEKLEAHGYALDRIENTIHNSLKDLEKIMALQVSDLERGMPGNLNEIGDTNGLDIPDLVEVEALIDNAEAMASADPLLQAQAVILPTVTRFKELSVTKSIFRGVTSRGDRITRVDNALAAYHATPGLDALRVLRQEIETYLQINHDSGRVPAVLFLQSQVNELISQHRS